MMCYHKNHWRFFHYQPDWSIFSGPFENGYQSDDSMSCIVVCDEDDGGTYIGYIVYADLEDNRMRILYIEVDPDKQGQGIGKNLVKKAIKDFQQTVNEDLKFVELTAKDSAVGFYETLGFIKTKEFTDQDKTEMVLYV